MITAPRSALYFAYHRATGGNLGGYVNQYRRELSERDPEALRRELLGALLGHCASAVPYYRERMGSASTAEDALRELPLLTKDDVRANSEQLRSDDLDRRRWHEVTSGGSTGEPIRLIQDRDCNDRLVAIQLLYSEWLGRRIGEPEVLLWGSEADVIDGTSGSRMKIANRLTRKKYVNAFRITPDDMRHFLRLLSVERPKLVLGYAQPLYEAAVFAEEHSVDVPRQNAVVSTAGTLYEFMRERIEAVMGCPVLNLYGSREVGNVAGECPEGRRMHVFPWGSWVEIVDEDGRPVPPGTEGNVVVTSLANYAMPLVRYFIGDRATIEPEPRCECGRPGLLLARVAGRTVDVFRAKGGTIVDGEYFTHLMYFRDWVRQFQVVQEGLEDVVFRVVPTDAPRPEADLEEITANTRKVMGEGCRVTFDFTEEIEPAPSGKRSYTISKVTS